MHRAAVCLLLKTRIVCGGTTRYQSNKTSIGSSLQPRLRCPRFDASGTPSVLFQSQRALFTVVLCISSNHTMRENNRSNTGLFCGHWQIHITPLCNSQLAKSLGRVRCALGSISAMASDSVSAPIRRLFSVSCLSNASACNDVAGHGRA